MNVVLIGLRGSGKSTCGKILARKLGWPFLDSDELVQERAGKPIWRVFEDSGEEGFNDLETEVIRQAARRDQVVIAAGGGSVQNARNVQELRRKGFVVHLGGSPKELWRRIEADNATASKEHRSSRNTQLKSEQDMEALLLQRSAAYSSARDVEVRVEHRVPDQIVAAIILLMRTRGLLSKDFQTEP